MIKFRVWDKEDKAYTANKYLFEIVPDGKAFDLVSAVDFDDSNGLVIEQYTGVDDKNGKPIYEGDIVKSDLNQLFAVYFGEQTHEENYGDIFKFQGFNLCTGSGYPGAVDITYEAIGNVHDNPGLLEEDK